MTARVPLPISRGAGRLAVVGLALTLVAAACTPRVAAPGAQDTETLTVFAAASLRDVFGQLEQRWEDSNPDVRLVAAFDGSNVLATQIAQGAPADVFLSADTERPQSLASAGLTAGRPVSIARNRIAIVSALGDDGIETLADLGVPGVRIVAAGRSVPITRYSERFLDLIAATMPAAPDYLQRVEANIVSREDNVRAALAKVELGEGDAAIVYLTDALSSDRVRQIAVPAGVSVSVEYGAVQVSEREAAAAFIDWLRGPEATATFIEAGFEPVRR
ncbi:MAG: molybdate ABC transporter substrate-binding protein [Chloroflexota bacterium]